MIISHHFHPDVIASFASAFAPPDKQLSTRCQRWLGEKLWRIEAQVFVTQPVHPIHLNCRVVPLVTQRHPHGTVRAQLRHTVLQVMVSL